MSKEFLVDPVGFMRENIVVPPINWNGNDSARGLRAMAMVPAAWGPASQVGRKLRLLTLCPPPPPGGPGTAALFMAYWCPYGQNTAFACDLGDEARFCFTPPMNGCSFGMSRGPAGVKVAHANAGEAGRSFAALTRSDARFDEADARIFQGREQAEQLKYVLQDDNPSIIGPGSYRTDGFLPIVTATTFGVLGDEGWAFYVQKWVKRKTGGVWKYFLRDVVKLI